MIVGRAVAISVASPAAVWAALVDPARWPTWDEELTWVVVESTLRRGGYVTAKPVRGRQTAFRIEEAVPPQRLVLGLGVGPLARLRLTWTVVPGEGGAEIELLVAISGPLARRLLGPVAERLAVRLATATNRLAALARK